MSDEKGGFNLSIGGDVQGDVAQTIDKSQHQTTNVEGDMHGDINNSQGDLADTFDAAREAAPGDVEREAVNEIEAAVMAVANIPDDLPVPQEQESKFGSAIELLKSNAPMVARIACNAALNMLPGGGLMAGIVNSVLNEL